MTRPTLDWYWMDVAFLIATRSTCLRREVGCVLVDRRGRVLSTGYNGVASGVSHCNRELDKKTWSETVKEAMYEDTKEFVDALAKLYPYACQGAASRSGTDIDRCEAVHAEQNALVQCRDPDEILTCYVTTSPCVSCVKLLLNTATRRIVFSEEYPGAAARDLWLRSDLKSEREWIYLTF